MLEAYEKHAEERRALGIPPLPMTRSQTEALCALLEAPPSGREEMLLGLLENRVPAGVDPAAEVKADFLGRIVRGESRSPLVNPRRAVEILGTMVGGYNTGHLVAALANEELRASAVKALSRITLVYDAFDTIAELAATNPGAQEVLRSWAEAEWFTSRPELPERFELRVFKVEGETNTDDLSPAGDAATRPDIPLHALAMGRARFPGGIDTIAEWRSAGHQVAFVGDVVGTGSSRKSACNSVLWYIGEDVPAVPNKRRAGVIIGGAIAPIFFNTAEDSGGLPLVADVSGLATGDDIVVDTRERTISKRGEVVSEFALRPITIADEYRAGGRIPLIIGRALTARARAALGLGESDVFVAPDNPEASSGQGFTQAQKIVGRAVGRPGVLPGTACEPAMTTVLSQDTTGPMTADEIAELACLRFEAPLFLQSFCHTAAYPKPADVAMHKRLPAFIAERGGVPLRPGDGVCHSWVNRLLVPDTVGTGGDSHTRFPVGISFPAGSGLVAFAGAMGFMPLDMPESVLVRFHGELRPGITLRDVVNAVPYQAIQLGLLTVPKKNKKNPFNGRILEMRGLPDLTVEQAFELTDASAERSAAAACIELSQETVEAFMRSNLALVRRLIDDGYQDRDALTRRAEAMETWLADPQLQRADENAEYAEVIDIDLGDIREPILACPNDPDDVRLLSEVAGTPVQEVFIGSCMTNIGHFRAAGKIWEGRGPHSSTRATICPPTRMDQAKLKDEAYFATFNKIDARIEVPGCSLCMGNQQRVPDGVTVYSTSTRNFDNRMGKGAQVFLGSAEVGAVVAVTGELPTPDTYFAAYAERVAPHTAEVYDFLSFDQLGEFDAIYNRRDL
jgi:aconitate hydratase 2/2-methylisocitrate dehydratase